MSEQSNKSSIKTSPSFTEDETTESKVGGTTYIVSSNYKTILYSPLSPVSAE
ncbi:MAG: hypothetical protein FWG45_03500 [Oscillospiraceae bacterium]|nr:hypothetical protein [Oscillospiraceae bacterium]